MAIKVTQSNLKHDLLKIQWKQHKHDELYHNDIARLPQRDKITHFVLHMGKYSGTMVSTNLAETDKLNEKITDCGIIITSMANMFQINLGKLTDARLDERGIVSEVGLSALPRIIVETTEQHADRPVINFSSSLMEIVRCSGVMADALTKHRNTLDGDIRNTMAICIEVMWFSYLRMYGEINSQPGATSWHSAIRNRLAFVESKNLFAEFLPKYVDDFR